MSLPPMIGVSSAVQRAAEYAGPVASERFVRLAADGIGWATPCEARLVFGRDGRRRQVQCEIRGALALRCEPCEQWFAREVNIATQWTLVETDEAEQAALAEAEPVRFADDQLAVDEALEQEVILDLPVIARCPACEQKLAAEPSMVKPGGPTHKPFAGLKLGKQ
jgi:uncharacterized protein